MATDILMLINGRLHLSVPTTVITASSTQPGYAIDNAREVDLVQAWKGPDSTTNDEYLQADGGSIGFLGAQGATAWAALSYDTRSLDQDVINLNTDAADDPAMPTQSTRAAWTLNKTANAMTCELKTFVITTPAKRYYRLYQPGGARSETTGTRTARVMNWDLYSAADIISVPLINPGNSEAAYAISQIGRVASMRTVAGFPRTNRWAKVGYEFEINFGPASDTLWQSVRDQFDAIGGNHRAIYVAKEGLKNAAQANFFMCRLASPDWDASLRYRGNYDVRLRFETEVWI